MKKISLVFILFFTLIQPAAAWTDGNAWRFALGYSFLNNVKEIRDAYKHLLRETRPGKDVYNASFGIRFQPYYQFENGMRAGVGAGPLILMVGDVRHVQIPFNATIGYTFFADSPISVYAKGGVAFHIASGDFYAGSSPGFYGGIGCVFFSSKPVRLGFETAWDASEITLDRAPGQTRHEKIKTGELTFFLYADF